MFSILRAVSRRFPTRIQAINAANFSATSVPRYANDTPAEIMSDLADELDGVAEERAKLALEDDGDTPSPFRSAGEHTHCAAAYPSPHLRSIRSTRLYRETRSRVETISTRSSTESPNLLIVLLAHYVLLVHSPPSSHFQSSRQLPAPLQKKTTTNPSPYLFRSQSRHLPPTRYRPNRRVPKYLAHERLRDFDG